MKHSMLTMTACCFVAGCGTDSIDTFSDAELGESTSAAMFGEDASSPARGVQAFRKPRIASGSSALNASTAIYGHPLPLEERAYYDLRATLVHEKEAIDRSRWSSSIGAEPTEILFEPKYIYRFLATMGEFEFPTMQARTSWGTIGWSNLDSQFDSPTILKAVVNNFHAKFPTIARIDIDLGEVNPVLENHKTDAVLFYLKSVGISLRILATPARDLELEPPELRSPEQLGQVVRPRKILVPQHDFVADPSGPINGGTLSVELPIVDCANLSSFIGRPEMSGVYCGTRLLRAANVPGIGFDTLAQSNPPGTYLAVMNEHPYAWALNLVIDAAGPFGLNLRDRLNQCAPIGPLPRALAQSMTTCLQAHGKEAVFSYHNKLTDLVVELQQHHAPMLVIQYDTILDANALPLAQSRFTPNVKNLPKFSYAVVTKYDLASDTYTVVTPPTSPAESATGGHYDVMNSATLMKKWLWSTGSLWADGQLEKVGVAAGMMTIVRHIPNAPR